MDVVVREARPEELMETVYIYIECHRQDFPFLPDAHRQKLVPGRELQECCDWLDSNPVNRVFAAFVDGLMAGYIAVGPNTGEPSEYEGEVTGFFVRKAYRGRGIGLHLLHAGAEHLSRQGYSTVTVYTLGRGDSAQYYRRLGAELVMQVVQRFSGQAESVDVLGWDLSALLATLDARLLSKAGEPRRANSSDS